MRTLGRRKAVFAALVVSLVTAPVSYAEDMFAVLDGAQPGTPFKELKGRLLSAGWHPDPGFADLDGARCQGQKSICRDYPEVTGCWLEPPAISMCSLWYRDELPLGSRLMVLVRIDAGGEPLYESWDEQAEGGRG